MGEQRDYIDHIVGVGAVLAILLILAFVLTGWPIR